MTIEEREKEIAELQSSRYVTLAKKEYNYRHRREQYLYNLRSLDKKGRELAASGLTLEELDKAMGKMDYEEDMNNE